MKCTRPMVDVRGRLVEVGDIIYRPIFSFLEPSYVLRITPYAIYVSVKKVIYSGKISYVARNNNNVKIVEKHYVARNNNIDTHNNVVRVARYESTNHNFPNVIIVRKQAVIPENLKRFL